MTAYRTVVVGTDGSESSLRAVDRAAKIAADSDARLIIATGYYHRAEDSRAADTLRDEDYKVRGNAPVYDLLHDAHDRARAAGAKNIAERAVESAPVHALVEVAEQADADLLVVGNAGLNAVIGRFFSVPGGVATRAKTDVLIVHTTD